GRDPHLYPAPVRVLDDLEQVALAVVRVGDDQLVGRVLGEDGAQALEAAEPRQVERVARRAADDADEVVVDPAVNRPERPQQVVEMLPLADDDRTPPDAQPVQDLAADRVVARPEHPGQHGADHERRRDQPEGREVVAGAEPEGGDEQRDDDERRDDPAVAGATLALRVQPRLPEDERRDEGDEREVVRLRVRPEDPPEDRRVAVIELADDERGVDADAEAKRSSASSEARLSVRKTRLRSGVGLSRYGRLRRMSPNGASGGRASAGARCTSFVATARFMLLVQLTEKRRPAAPGGAAGR